MKIRQARKKDIGQIYDLEKSTFSAADAADMEDIERRVNAHSENFWLAVKDGRVVSGINGITTDEENLCDEMYSGEEYYSKNGSWLMIFGVSTLPEYQHSGLASKVMQEALRDVKSCRLKGVVLACKPELCSFYRRFGFRDEGVCDSAHGGDVWHQMRLLRSDIKIDYRREAAGWAITIAAAVAIAFVIERFVILNCNVPTGSMLETIRINDKLIGSRLSYIFSEPERGDIAIFIWPDDGETVYIKRIIGLPGETVEIKDGKIYIDGSSTPLNEEYLSDEARTDVRSFGPYEVPENCYFMLGDNRTNSADSRFWKNTYVDRGDILAKAEFVYYPLSEISWLGDGADYKE